MQRDLPTVRTFMALTTLLLVNEVLSYAAYTHREFGAAVFIVLVFASLVIAMRRLEYGLVMLFLELFVGGKGYLYSIHIGAFALSIRVALFIVVMLVWLFRYRHKFDWSRLPRPIGTLLPLLALFLAWGVLYGLWSGHGALNVYYDSNAYLFLGLIVVLLAPTIDWNRLKPLLLGVLAAAATVLGIKSLLTLGLFTHLGFSGLVDFYRWIRNTGIGEIAPIGHTSFRVFFQSQIYGVLAFFTLAPFLAARNSSVRRPWWLLVPLTLGLTAVIISLSRSFWLGGIIALLVGLDIACMRYRWSVVHAIRVATFVILLLGTSYALTSWAVNFPYPFATDASKSLLLQRLSNFKEEPAASSRLQMFRPLVTAIAKKPILGSGFAKTVTYRSSDPRQTSSKRGGLYTTDAFELGYLDIALKIGLAGLLTYLLLLGHALKGLYALATPLAFGMFIGLVALVVINGTTPYLNHPLGIGFLLLALTLGRMQPSSIPPAT